MGASRFERLAKKDQDAVRRFVERRLDTTLEPDKILANHYAIFQDNVNGLATRPKGRYSYNSAADLFASEMSFIASAFIQRGIAHRLLHDDIPELVEMTFVASRLKYLSDLAKLPEYSGTDCLHVFDVLSSLGARDHSAGAALIRRHPGPARDGHPFTVLLCNAVTGLMTRSGVLPELKERLIDRKEGAYNKAMLQALVAIIDRDAKRFTECLEEMLNGHRRVFGMANGHGLLAYFPLQTHGMYRLAAQVFRDVHDLPCPDAPESWLWDREFHDADERAGGLSILDHFSPVLTQWAEQLPVSLEPNLFAVTSSREKGCQVKL